jgi:hypothetical protein
LLKRKTGSKQFLPFGKELRNLSFFYVFSKVLGLIGRFGLSFEKEYRRSLVLAGEELLRVTPMNQAS